MATDKKISSLPLNPTINGSEEIAEERGGSNYKNTLSQVKTFVKDGLNTSEVTETTDKKYVTDAEISKIASSVNSKTAGEPTGSDVVLNTVSLTQAEYDLGTPIATTFYLITDA